MARKITEIYDEMIAGKAAMVALHNLQPDIDSAQTLLTELSSKSRVAVWRLMLFVTAVAIWTHEKLWDVFRAEVDAIVAAAVPGTAQWYRNQSLQFQLGDEMKYADYKYSYDPVDTTKQIIKRASATGRGGDVVLKVAREAGGVPAKLAPDELLAFTAYIAKIKFAGTFCSIISDDADLINVSMRVYTDASIINADGEALNQTSSKPVEDAINNYLATLPWDGVVINSALTDAVQAVPGVSDVVLLATAAKAAQAANYQSISRTYRTVAGYIVANELNILYTSV
jgi:hypothetical protein